MAPTTNASSPSIAALAGVDKATLERIGCPDGDCTQLSQPELDKVTGIVEALIDMQMGDDNSTAAAIPPLLPPPSPAGGSSSDLFNDLLGPPSGGGGSGSSDSDETLRELEQLLLAPPADSSPSEATSPGAPANPQLVQTQPATRPVDDDGTSCRGCVVSFVAVEGKVFCRTCPGMGAWCDTCSAEKVNGGSNGIGFDFGLDNLFPSLLAPTITPPPPPVGMADQRTIGMADKEAVEPMPLQPPPLPPPVGAPGFAPPPSSVGIGAPLNVALPGTGR